MTMTVDAMFHVVFACLCVIYVLFIIYNGNLKKTCDRDCDFLQVYRGWGGTGTVTTGTVWRWEQFLWELGWECMLKAAGIGLGHKFPPCICLVDRLHIPNSPQ